MKNRVIKITEQHKEDIFADIIAEGLIPAKEKVLAIVDIIKRLHIIKQITADISSNGFLTDVKSMAIVDRNGEILKQLSLTDLVAMLDSLPEVRVMFIDDKDRRKFLEEVIKYWFDGKISKNGLLPVNFIK